MPVACSRIRRPLLVDSASVRRRHARSGAEGGIPANLALGLFLLLTACNAHSSGLATSVGPTGVILATAEVGTVLPGGDYGTSAPSPSEAPPTPIATLSSGLPPTELKYRLLDEFPDMFFCDPDFYPVARADEAQLAIERFPELQANSEEFEAILAHNGLGAMASFTNDEKLVIYREHKRLAAIIFELAENGYDFQLRTADGNMEGYYVQGSIAGDGLIRVKQRDPALAECPICLARHTLIATPLGAVAVEQLRPGDTVWTADALGGREAAVVLETVRVPAAPLHQVVHLVLDDGRELWASPGHPTADGRRLADLKTGDVVDGARVETAERVEYKQAQTYDLLAQGWTGYYWANGILLGSTLKRP